MKKAVNKNVFDFVLTGKQLVYLWVSSVVGAVICGGVSVGVAFILFDKSGVPLWQLPKGLSWDLTITTVLISVGIWILGGHYVSRHLEVGRIAHIQMGRTPLLIRQRPLKAMWTSNAKSRNAFWGTLTIWVICVNCAFAVPCLLSLLVFDMMSPAAQRGECDFQTAVWIKAVYTSILGLCLPPVCSFISMAKTQQEWAAITRKKDQFH